MGGVWTPDSSAVIVTKNTGSRWALWVVPVTGSQPRRLEIDPNVWLEGSGGGLCQERARGARCCTRDEGGPFGAGLQEQAPNSRELLSSNGGGGERHGKGVRNIASCVGWRDERKQTTEEASKDSVDIKTGGPPLSPGRAWRTPGYWPCGVRGTGGMTPALALVRNLRTWWAVQREKAQAGDPRGRKY